jgi:hypothetical protein
MERTNNAGLCYKIDILINTEFWAENWMQIARGLHGTFLRFHNFL